MEPGDWEQKIGVLDRKLESIHQSVEKMRKYFLWSLMVQLAFIFIPLLILMFVLPFFLSSYLQDLGGFL